MNNILKNKYLWIGVVLGIVLGDLLGLILFRPHAKPIKENNPDISTATSSVYALTVADQPAGNTVSVFNAHVATTTWLAVRESNGDLLGRILGAYRIPPGETKEVLIELLRPTVAHLMYAVVMYEDDGDKAFDNKLDTLITENGQPVMYPFKVN